MLAIIIVNYKSEKRTIDYVNNELTKVTTPHVTVIVNNEATESSNFELQQGLNATIVYDINEKLKTDKKCFVIPHFENLGFAKGNNLGAKFVVNNFKPEFLLFTNNDIQFNQNNIVERLIDRIEKIPDAAIIGPKIIGLEGELQSPEPYLPFFYRFLWMYWLTPFLSKKRKTKIFKLDYSKNAKEGFHYKIMGSFFIAKVNDYFKCGMMDSNTFLFAEEVILSERLKKINKKAYYYPDVSVIHTHGETISAHIKSKNILLNQYKSLSYYYSKYKGINRFSVFLGRISVMLYWFLNKMIKK